MKPNVKRENGSAWIEGVPVLAWGRGKNCTLAGSLEAALRVSERPFSYTDLMGYSGLAFRIRWARCPSCAVGEMPEEIQAITKATGWDLPTDVQLGQKNPDMTPVVPKVIASINGGVPVVAYGSCLDLGVVYGYEDGGKTLLLRDYHKGEAPLRIPAEKLGPLQTYPRIVAEPVPERDAFLTSLRIAVKNWRRGRADIGIAARNYHYGDSAFVAWIDDLKRLHELAATDQERVFHTNSFAFITLRDARQAAVVFLRSHASCLNASAESTFQGAASVYEQVADLLSRVPKDLFFGPHSGKSVRDWSAAIREREQEVLAQARNLEQKAVAEIEIAIAKEGKGS